MVCRRIVSAVSSIVLASLLAGCANERDRTSGAAGPVPDPSIDSAASPAGPSSSAPALPTMVPDNAVLQPTDWPAGQIVGGSNGVDQLEQTEPSACQQRTAYPSDRYRLIARVVRLGSSEPESGGVRETVVIYASGRAAEAMTQMRHVLAACPSYRIALDGPATRSYRLEREKFAGDDALLVRRSDQQDGSTREYSWYLSVVRLQDVLVTTITETGEGTSSEKVARRLAAVGAERASCLPSAC